MHFIFIYILLRSTCLRRLCHFYPPTKTIYSAYFNINVYILNRVQLNTCIQLDGRLGHNFRQSFSISIKVIQDVSGKITLCFIKDRVILFIFDQLLAFTQKPSPRLSTNLYNQIYFDRSD